MLATIIVCIAEIACAEANLRDKAGVDLEFKTETACRIALGMKGEPRSQEMASFMIRMTGLATNRKYPYKYGYRCGEVFFVPLDGEPT